MKNLLTLAVLLSGSFVAAETIISVEEAATTGLEGFTTYTLTASSDQGDIVGFDFVGDGSLGIFGDMNQVNPAGNATVFQDANGFFGFVGADVSQDSQFNFLSTLGIALNGNEDSTSLQAALGLAEADAISGPVAFAQIAAPAGSEITYAGNFTILTSNGNILEDVSGSFGGATNPNIPEPTTAMLVALGLTGFAARRRV